ncbi:hypothetical protein [Caulobacter henricii]|uniref:Uncharacterized protein n=1 Tax=Caulobacter henricii TaxID=69395 RepID=A0A0P0NY10_9CAUL|nr:hypothetical protein [Caulobacter henricii]ALL13003.1 hypothetical protein AQ619_06350 [Caulobacter henricii]
MLRAILAVLGAIAANIILVTLCEMVLKAGFPPPPGLDLNDPAQLKTFAQSMPPLALAGLVVGWAVGAFGSAAAGFLIARKTWAAWVGPAFNLLGVVMSITMIPHPLWVAVIGVVMPFIAAWSAPRLWGARPAATEAVASGD